MTRPALAIAVADISELPADDYVGLIDEAAIECLSVRLATEGLLTPIWVRRNGNAAKSPWSVIAGRHRLRAACKLGWIEIDAVQYADASASRDALRRLQIAENLDRRDLRPIERARFIMDRWLEAAAAVVPSIAANQQSEAIRARWNVWEAVSHTPTGERRAVDKATGDICGGKSDRWVRTYRSIFETIVVGLPDLFEALNAHPLGESLSAIEKLVRYPKSKRLAATVAILARPTCDNLKQILEEAGLEESNGNRLDPEEPDAIFMSAFWKMKGPRRSVSLCALADELTATEVLNMVEIFKKKGILRDTVIIA